MEKSLLVTLEFPPQKGGVANYLSNIYSRLPYDKFLVLAPKQKNSRLFDRRAGYRIKRVHMLYNFIWPKWLPLYFTVKNIVQSEKIKLLHFSHILPIGYIAYRLKQRMKLRYLVFCHGMDVLKAQETPRKKEWTIKILKNASGIIANSEFTKGLLINLGVDEARILVVYPCPNITVPEETVETYNLISKYGLYNKRIILSVGRLVERKGIDKVLEALPRLLSKFKDIMYVVVGDGPDIERLGRITRDKGLQNLVRFVGEVSEQDLVKFYSLADIFIMPSRQIGPDVEGFGIVYLEANLFGMPVIGGRSGGVPEAVIDKYSGLLVNPNSDEEIFQALFDLLADPEWAKILGKQGRTRVQNNFVWRKEVEKFRLYLSGHKYG